MRLLTAIAIMLLTSSQSIKLYKEEEYRDEQEVDYVGKPKDGEKPKEGEKDKEEWVNKDEEWKEAQEKEKAEELKDDSKTKAVKDGELKAEVWTNGWIDRSTRD